MSADTQPADTNVKNDHDSLRKEALEQYFPEFLALLFPAIHAEIDWTQGVQFLDKEFQQIVREAKSSDFYAARPPYFSLAGRPCEQRVMIVRDPFRMSNRIRTSRLVSWARPIPAPSLQS